MKGDQMHAARALKKATPGTIFLATDGQYHIWNGIKWLPIGVSIDSPSPTLTPNERYDKAMKGI